MEEDFIPKSIKNALDNLPDSFNILEEQIDIEVQMKYFEHSKKLRKRNKHEDYLAKIDQLFDGKSSTEEIKEILTGLAGLTEVEAFRAIEKYCKTPDKDLEMWAILSLQESKMMLKSSLLDEQQVFISTGLGGVGQKLRYFAVFLNKDETSELTELQKKIVRTEFTEIIAQNDGEVEELTFYNTYAIGMLILPLKAGLKEIFEKIINECNVYGNFLSDDVLVTNVKKLTEEEIFTIIKDRRSEDEQGRKNN